MPPKKRPEAQADYSGRPPVRSLFGWCMTGHHEMCIMTFPGHECPCKCHSPEVDNQALPEQE